MLNLTTFNHTAHKVMWRYILDNPGSTKLSAINSFIQDCSKWPMNNCFACETCKVVCKYCPLDWSAYAFKNDPRPRCASMYSPYTRWYNAMEEIKSVASLPVCERSASLDYCITVIKESAYEIINLPISPNFEGAVL